VFTSILDIKSNMTKKDKVIFLKVFLNISIFLLSNKKIV